MRFGRLELQQEFAPHLHCCGNHLPLEKTRSRGCAWPENLLRAQPFSHALCRGAESQAVSFPLAVDILGINVLELCYQKCWRCPGSRATLGLTEQGAPPCPAPAVLAMSPVRVKQREVGGQHRREPRALMAWPLDGQTSTGRAPSAGDQLSLVNGCLSLRNSAL